MDGLLIINCDQWYTKLKCIRISLGLTQKQAAELCLVDLKSYSTWENNIHYPRKASQKLIAKSFNVKVEDIFSPTDRINLKGGAVDGKPHKNCKGR